MQSEEATPVAASPVAPEEEAKPVRLPEIDFTQKPVLRKTESAAVVGGAVTEAPAERRRFAPPPVARQQTSEVSDELALKMQRIAKRNMDEGSTPAPAPHAAADHAATHTAAPVARPVSDSQVRPRVACVLRR